MTRLPFANWDTAACGDEVVGLSLAEAGAVYLLRLAYWRGNGLPDDPGALARICGITRGKFAKMAPKILAFFEIRDGRLFHSAMDAARERAMRNSQTKQRAANARWHPDGDDNPGSGYADTETESMHMHVLPQSNYNHNYNLESKNTPVRPPSCPEPVEAAPAAPSPTVARRRHERIAGERGTRIPPDWMPGTAEVALALSLGLVPDAMASEFLAYWQGEGGSRARKMDWQATFSSWCRRQADKAAQRGPAKPVRLSAEDELAQVMAILAARDGAAGFGGGAVHGASVGI